jgi:hypothetical protein
MATQHTAPPSSESGLVKSLQKQIRGRDKRIEELEFKLDALKLIDQDFDKRKTLSAHPRPCPPSSNHRQRSSCQLTGP